MTIRSMEERDLDQVADLEQENFSVPWKRRDFQTYLDREEGLFLVLAEEEKVLGYMGVILAPPEGDITNVSVSRAARGRGIGTALVKEMLRRTEERGVHTLFLEVRKSNETAIRLYRREGFREVGLRKNYYEKPSEDALIFTREG